MQIFLQAALNRETEDAALLYGKVKKKKGENLQVWKNRACCFNESNITVPSYRCVAGTDGRVFIV